MPRFDGRLPGKLPHVGTTIFTVMSRLAAEHGAINLSQGFPDFAAPAPLVELVAKHMRAGSNQYAPMAGALPLRQAIAAQVEAGHGVHYDPEHEITVTAGGTEAIFCAITCAVRPGDEVILLEPAYDSYAPAVELAGGVARRAQLGFPGYRPDWAQVRALLSPRTRLLVVNTPHNPTGAVFSAQDLAELEALIRGTDLLVLSDEVYEHMIYDGARHHGCVASAALRDRSFVVGSFGKTFHVTGWKVGYVLAPAALTAELRKVHQFVTFAVNTPVQLALAEHLADERGWRELAAFYQQKRDRFVEGLRATRLEPLPCQGTYFQLVSYARVSDEPDVALCERLTRAHGVAAIPVSVFYATPRQDRVLRLCFAKGDDTLALACERLARL
jgi:methionine aminotransferase